MEIEAIFLGMLLGCIYYEIAGLTPGGIVVPGYIALVVRQPLSIAMTMAVAVLTFAAVRGLRRLVILYGRRMFLASVMIGFLLAWGAEAWIAAGPGASSGLRVIGYVIPGLMANEMQKQGVLRTVVSLMIVGGTVVVLLRLLGSVTG